MKGEIPRETVLPFFESTDPRCFVEFLRRPEADSEGAKTGDDFFIEARGRQI